MLLWDIPMLLSHNMGQRPYESMMYPKTFVASNHQNCDSVGLHSKLYPSRTKCLEYQERRDVMVPFLEELILHLVLSLANFQSTPAHFITWFSPTFQETTKVKFSCIVLSFTAVIDKKRDQVFV